MPFHEVEIQKSTKDSISVEYYDKSDDNKPHNEYEPIFLIAGPFENGLDLFVKLADYLKDNLKIPHSVYIHEGETNFSTFSTEQALELSAKCLAKEIMTKLSKSANITSCLLVVTSWKSFEVMLAANLITQAGFKPPVLYIVNGLPHKEAKLFFAEKNCTFALEEIGNHLNHLAKLCSLKMIDFDDPFTQLALAELETWSAENCIDCVKNLILKINATTQDVSNFNKYVTAARKNIINLLEYKSNINYKTSSKLYLLFSEGPIKKFNTSSYYGWDQYTELKIAIIKDKKLTSLPYSALFDRTYALNLENSLMTLTLSYQINNISDQINIIGSRINDWRECINTRDSDSTEFLKKSLIEFVETINKISPLTGIRANTADATTNSSSTYHFQTPALARRTITEQLSASTAEKISNVNLNANHSDSFFSPNLVNSPPLLYKSLVSSDESEQTEKSSQTMEAPPQSSNFFFPLPKTASRRLLSPKGKTRSPQSQESDPENQESSSSPSTYGSFVSPVSSLNSSFNFSDLSSLNSPILTSPLDDNQQKMPDLNLGSIDTDVTDSNTIPLEEEQNEMLVHDNATKYYLFKR